MDRIHVLPDELDGEHDEVPDHSLERVVRLVLRREEGSEVRDHLEARLVVEEVLVLFEVLEGRCENFA